VQQHEKRLARKISDQLSFIPGVMVSVTVDANTRSVTEQAQIYDTQNVVHKEQETSSREEESSDVVSSGGEPGAQSNISMDVSGGAGSSGSSSTVREEKVKFVVQPSVKMVTTNTPAGDATVVAATVRVPRSYFVNMYRGANPAAPTEVTDALLMPLMDVELANIRNDVIACTGLADEGKVRVSTYWDSLPALTGTASAEAGSISLSVGSYAKELAVGGLALVSLFMMMLMVRRGAAVPTAAAPAPAGPAPALGGVEDIAGEALEGGGAMDGMEVDDDVIRTQQMIEQVSTMVKENPDSAASLVKRWMNK
jgi:flagellar biosynthesis/type III secretory pathway M-ring protein FliF/YscJ